MNQRLTKLLSLLLTVLLLIFAYEYISGLIRQTDFSEVSINWFWILAASILFTTNYLIMSLNWWLSVQILKPEAPRKQMLAFFDSQPYKYMPTSIFSFSSRAVYGKKLGLTLKQSSFVQIFENASLLGSNFVLFTVLYLSTLNLGWGLLVAAFSLIIAATLFVSGRHIHLRFRGRHLDLDLRHLVKVGAVTTIGWVFSGLAFTSLNAALGLNIKFLEFMAANTAAFSLSLLAVFAPGGIGVREVVYNVFSVSSVAIIFWRMLTFVLDFLLGGIAIMLTKRATSRD